MDKLTIRIIVFGVKKLRHKPFKSAHIYTHFGRYF